LYPQNIWDREVEPALDGSILDEKVADLNVRFRRGKTTAGLDQKQGRVTIEQHLLDYAGIDRELIAVRAGAYWRILPATADV
jgi:DNA-binding transcriptional regulator/RsmH inhibitor MraZ